jgi:phage antirepressor YoqD-like protein
MSRGNRNLIGQIRSSQHYPNQHQERSVSSIRQSPQVEYANAELDSHADTVVAGATCKVLEFTEHSCDIYLYSDQYEPMKSVPVAKVATAYDHPLTGETFRLVFGQALYLGDKK